MTLTLEIPQELAESLGPDAFRLSREALALEALRQGLWSEAQLGKFLGIDRWERDGFLKKHGVELFQTWEDIEQSREMHGRVRTDLTSD